MLRKHCRPWGLLDWVLERLPERKWSVLGCVATEERCTGAWEIVQKNSVGASLFLQIDNPPSRFTGESEGLRKEFRTQLERLGVPSLGVYEEHLFATDGDIVSIADSFLASCEQSAIVDITCLPKRFFFPLIRRLFESEKIKTLLATYTVPQKYFHGTLAEDHRPLSHLPLFGIQEFPEPKPDTAIVGIGFLPLGITELLDPYRENVAIKLLFPFPPGPTAFRRNWRFVDEVRKIVPHLARDPIRVEAYNVSDTFDHIVQLASEGGPNVIFAPYGPKPMSLAKCLYASRANSAVYYTQPTFYHPKYSTGIKRTKDNPDCYGYCIKIDGRDLCSIPKRLA